MSVNDDGFTSPVPAHLAVSSTAERPCPAAAGSQKEADSARARNRLVTHARLKASATELFAARGLRNVTTHDIARGAGVAAGTFYLHFKDKRVLLREIVLEALADLRTEMDLAARGCSGVDATRKHVESVVTFAERRGEVVRILFSHENEWEELQTHVLNTLADYCESVLRTQQTEGLIGSDVAPAIAAQAITGLQARVIDWWTKDPSRATRDAVIETLYKLQLTGVYGPAVTAE